MFGTSLNGSHSHYFNKIPPLDILSNDPILLTHKHSHNCCGGRMIHLAKKFLVYYKTFYFINAYINK